MTQHEQWQLTGSSAELYQRHLVPLITSLWAADLIDRSAPRARERVLDVACGTGVVARLAAERMRFGRVVGLDLNAGMLAVARTVPQDSGPQIEWCEGSAQSMPFLGDSFDLVLCQLGLQFFPDRPAALAEMFRVLAPSGRLALSVFTEIERTPVARALADALDQHLQAGASSVKRSEHCLSNQDALRGLVFAAGFRQIHIERVTKTITFASPRDYVRLQLSATPQADVVAAMAPPDREALTDAITLDIMKEMGACAPNGELVSPQESHVLTATK